MLFIVIIGLRPSLFIRGVFSIVLVVLQLFDTEKNKGKNLF